MGATDWLNNLEQPTRVSINLVVEWGVNYSSRASRNVSEGFRYGRLGDGRIILKWSLKKLGVRVWTGSE
jgi:hypothetical protein